MRTITFRGKSLATGEWLHGSLFNDGAEDYILPPQPSSAIAFEDYHVDQNTVGQFTGLCDKNGKEIFEGDIVKKHDPYNVNTSDYTGEGIWGKGRWKVPNFYLGCRFEADLFFDDFAGRKQEIIGSIYDNPELINQK